MVKKFMQMARKGTTTWGAPREQQEGSESLTDCYTVGWREGLVREAEAQIISWGERKADFREV